MGEPPTSDGHVAAAPNQYRVLHGVLASTHSSQQPPQACATTGPFRFRVPAKTAGFLVEHTGRGTCSVKSLPRPASKPHPSTTPFIPPPLTLMPHPPQIAVRCPSGRSNIDPMKGACPTSRQTWNPPASIHIHSCKHSCKHTHTHTHRHIHTHTHTHTQGHTQHARAYTHFESNSRSRSNIPSNIEPNRHRS